MSDSNNYETINETQSKFCKFSYVDYIVIASSLALIIAEDLDASDINILGNFFDVLGDELALIAAVKTCPSNDPLPSRGLKFTSRDLAQIKKSSSKKRIKKIKKKKIRKK